MDVSDEELMRRCAGGDERAFRLLAGRHAGRAAGLARRVTGNGADADEIVQEALLRVWTHAPRWKPIAAFSTWFYRIVLNLCLNRRRRAPFLPLDDAGDPHDPAADIVAQTENAETQRLVGEAIGALPDRQRAAIMLSYHDEFSNAEAAEILGVSVSALESLLVRAKRSLRADLEKRLDRA